MEIKIQIDTNLLFPSGQTGQGEERRGSHKLRNGNNLEEACHR